MAKDVVDCLPFSGNALAAGGRVTPFLLFLFAPYFLVLFSNNEDRFLYTPVFLREPFFYYLGSCTTTKAFPRPAEFCPISFSLPPFP